MVAPAAVVVLLDQATKQWALTELDHGRTIDVLWTLRLRLVFNRGTAFSLAEGAGPLLAVVALAVVATLVFSNRWIRTRPMSLTVGLIAGGAIGNLVDRVVRDGDGFLQGAVVDFVDLQWWPVFNVADSAIVLGAAGIALLSLIDSEAGAPRSSMGSGDAEPSDGPASDLDSIST